MRHFFTLLFLLGILFSNAQVNLSSSLTACYALDGNANDPISSLHGTLSSVTSTVDRFNTPNAAYAFAGNGTSRIELPNNPLLKSGQVSFSAWFRMNSLNSYYIVFAHNGCFSYHEGYSFGCANLGGGNFRLQIAKSFSNCSAGGQIILNGITSLSAQTWYHVGFYAGPDSLKLYLNGQLQSSLANSNPLVYSPTAKVYLGGSNLGVNLPLNGSMDNVRFYNRKLNGSEFQQLYLQDPTCMATPTGTAPTVAFSVSSVSLCAGNSISFTDLSGNNPTAWNWQSPGANPPNSSLQNPVISYSNPGTYIVSLVSSNTVGASNTATQSIVVLPNPSVNITASGNLLCVGQSMNLYAGGASNYTWSSGQLTSVINVSPGITTGYSVIGADLNGCLGNASFTVNLHPTPVVFLWSSQSTLCQGQSATLTATGAQSYTWSNFQNGNSIVVAPLLTSVYYVNGTDANNCSANASITVNVDPLPPVTATANKTLVCRGNPVLLTAAGAQTYVWNSSLNGHTIQVNPQFSSTYTVIGTHSSGCSNQALVYIQVSECVSLEEIYKSGEIRVYPNPAVDRFTVQLPSKNSYSLKVVDSFGRKILEQEANGASETLIDLIGKASGVYFLFVEDGQESRKIKITLNP